METVARLVSILGRYLVLPFDGAELQQLAIWSSYLPARLISADDSENAASLKRRSQLFVKHLTGGRSIFQQIKPWVRLMAVCMAGLERLDTESRPPTPAHQLRAQRLFEELSAYRRVRTK